MSDLFSPSFWRQALERAVKTGAQSAVLVIGQDALGFDVFSASWSDVFGFAVGGAALSVLTSLASVKVGPSDTPSVV